jgi:putative acetyltransferase
MTAPLHQDALIPDALTIRPIGLGDAPGLMALFNAERQKGLSAPPALTNVPDAIRRRLEGRRPNEYRLVALCAGEMIGQACLSLKETSGMLTIYVRDDYRRRGIASALLVKLVEASTQELKLDRIEVNVFCDNLPAIDLYKKLGFECETLQRNVGGETITMVKRL